MDQIKKSEVNILCVHVPSSRGFIKLQEYFANTETSVGQEYNDNFKSSLLKTTLKVFFLFVQPEELIRNKVLKLNIPSMKLSYNLQ